MVLPRTEFVYESIVDLAPTLQLGVSPLGDRRMVPITGGTFEGPGLRGTVLAGGADNELVALLKRMFATVKHAKPPASRKDSSEWYVIAQGFKGASTPQSESSP